MNGTGGGYEADVTAVDLVYWVRLDDILLCIQIDLDKLYIELDEVLSSERKSLPRLDHDLDFHQILITYSL